VRATSTADLQLPIAYYPGWRVTIDGREQSLDRPSQEGRMRVTTTPGVHRLEATFRRTPLRWLSELAALAGLLIVAVFAYRRRQGKGVAAGGGMRVGAGKRKGSGRTARGEMLNVQCSMLNVE
jgi:uncharacterized membrane protein YfhO